MEMISARVYVSVPSYPINICDLPQSGGHAYLACVAHMAEPRVLHLRRGRLIFVVRHCAIQQWDAGRVVPGFSLPTILPSPWHAEITKCGLLPHQNTGYGLSQ